MAKVALRKSPIWPAILSALVAPGIGQIINREFAKGFFLLATFLGSSMWFSKVLTMRLSTVLTGPPEQWMQNPDLINEGMMKLINTQNSDGFMTFFLLIAVIWVYSVSDAYLVARRALRSPAEHSPDETDHPLD